LTCLGRLADTQLLKMHRLQNKILSTIGNYPRCTPVRNLYTAFNLPYIYDYITKLGTQKAEAIQNHENEHVCRVKQGEARHRRYEKLTLVAVKLATVQVTKLPL
jgi:hypothetical protein